MKLIHCQLKDIPSDFELVAQHPQTLECLGYSATGIEYSGPTNEFEARYSTNGDISTLDNLKADYQLFLNNNVSQWIEAHCAMLTAERDRLDTSENATSEAHNTIWQTDPKSLAKLNNALTTYTALGSTPPDFKWWDATNTPHLASIQFLAEIAAADGVRQYKNHTRCVHLKNQVRALIAEPGVRSAIDAIIW